MKKLVFLILACGMYAHSFSQIDLSNKTVEKGQDKYVVSSAKGVGKGMGRLNLVFADSAEWSVDIYNSAKKFITNHSIKDRRNAADKKSYYDLTPGIYSFKLNTVMVENVPIEEGKETRLRTGLLDINTAGNWELRSENKQKYLTSGNKPKKIALPVGAYSLGAAKDFRLVRITDWLQDQNISEQLDDEVPYPFLETTNSSGSLGENGKLTVALVPISALGVDFEIGQPIESDWNPANLLFTLVVKKPYPDTTTVASTHESSVLLPPGKYRVTINGFYGEVSIEKGKETRLKAGFLRATKTGDKDVGLRIEKRKHPSTSYSPVLYLCNYQKNIVLPVLDTGYYYRLSKYSLKGEQNFGDSYNYDYVSHYEVVIKDKELIINGKKISASALKGHFSCN